MNQAGSGQMNNICVGNTAIRKKDGRSGVITQVEEFDHDIRVSIMYAGETSIRELTWVSCDRFYYRSEDVC